ncbi:hypothetical protein BVC71_02970 [Marivivens niveibacter]|uniref:Capsule biosynthesis protein n=1 Tax=Marivivens niveibacter TaxID=1930667 RepID=A0A251X236_9RHOB|nr:hypothetical protein [Marivivens niveibacter]OUD10475.1 hypothetical protein BVC71_02970 [Marivivens niveibacter]
MQKARSRISLVTLLFIVVVIVPTFVTGYYALVTKAPLFRSQTQFAVEDRQQGSSKMLGGLATAIGIVSGEPSAIYSVKRFIESPDALNALEEVFGFAEYYRAPYGDYFTQLPDSASSDAILAYYQRHVVARVSSKENIISLEVSAFDAATAQAIADNLLRIVEAFVNDLNARALNDQVRFQQANVEAAQQNVLDARLALTEWRNRNGAVDPMAQVQMLQGMIGNLETELSSVQSDLSLLEESEDADRFKPRIDALQDQERIILRQISSARDRLASSAEGAVSMQIDEYERLYAALEFAANDLELATMSLETARQVILQQQKYLLIISNPSLPSDRTFPILTKHVPIVFVACMLIFAIIALFANVTRDYRRV